MSRLFGFGSNGNGQLGIGHLEDTHTPTPCIGIPESEVIIKISGGGNHSAVITKTGRVFFAGFSQLGEKRMSQILKLSSEEQQPWTIYQERFNKIKWKDVACGWAFTILTSQEGKLYGVGTGRWNELCSDVRDEESLTEIPIHEKIISVACGWRHVVAVNEKGEAFGWGWGRYGQLGESKTIGNKKDIRPVQKIDLPQPVTQVACGHIFTIFRGCNGTVYGIGSNKYGQLGSEHDKGIITQPHVIYRNSIHIGAGWHHTLSQSSAGELTGHGRRDHGQITKTNVLHDVKQFFCGSEHTLAIQKDNLVGWGWNEHGNCTTDMDFMDEPTVIAESTNVYIFGVGCATSWFATTA
ncbi:hypothetical protein RMCBS344292_15132 [Rhizopus microsporus]|nr:hypothetical protein RMCBS344292_15132 [Rhizopus microsporus]